MNKDLTEEEIFEYYIATTNDEEISLIIEVEDYE